MFSSALSSLVALSCVRMGYVSFRWVAVCQAAVSYVVGVLCQVYV